MVLPVTRGRGEKEEKKQKESSHKNLGKSSKMQQRGNQPNGWC